MRPRTPGLAPVPSSAPGRRSELRRLERELAATRAPRARRLLAMERRRVLVADELAGELEPLEREPEL